jgi:hypothetical protein
MRESILKKIEKNERNYKIAFFGAILLEALFLLGYLMIADLSDRLHVLLLFSTVMIYSILILGMFALGAHTTRNTLRVLKALELLETRPE